MNFLFFGPQGSGKGTQAAIFAKKQSLCHISSGEMLRNYQGPLKSEIEFHLNSGNLIPDALMIKIVRERINKGDCKSGFILDGFPRNLAQSKELDKIAKIDNAFLIEISDEESIKRLSERRVCSKCGANYNLQTQPKPIDEKICDKCQGELIKRKDDNEEAIKQRLKTYHDETEILRKVYNTTRVNGAQEIEKVTIDIDKAYKWMVMFR
jgi:adenylate kinase